MQNWHDFMQKRAAPHIVVLPFAGMREVKTQAMETAINASKNINTAPAIGSTIGIMGTMDSTASASAVGVAAGLEDIVFFRLDVTLKQFYLQAGAL